jgi:hypothetical protein
LKYCDLILILIDFSELLKNCYNFFAVLLGFYLFCSIRITSRTSAFESIVFEVIFTHIHFELALISMNYEMQNGSFIRWELNEKISFL